MSIPPDDESIPPDDEPTLAAGESSNTVSSFSSIDWAKAAEFARQGSVHATQLDAPRTWQTDRGDELTGVAGDWLLSDGTNQWTVADAVFRATYRRRADGRYEKHATILAVRAGAEIAIPTLEGTATAHDGDWIARNPSGECWPITDEVFRRSYLPVSAPS